MKKLFFLVVTLLMICSVPLFAGGSSETKKATARKFSDNLLRWERSDIRSYSMRISYVAGNRPPQEFFVRVKDNRVVQYSVDGQEVSDLEGAENYTVEGLFRQTKEYVKSNKKKSPMLYVVEYDKQYGFVNFCTKIYNPDVKSGAAPSDSNFRLRVIDFDPEK